MESVYKNGLKKLLTTEPQSPQRLSRGVLRALCDLRGEILWKAHASRHFQDFGDCNLTRPWDDHAHKLIFVGYSFPPLFDLCDKFIARPPNIYIKGCKKQPGDNSQCANSQIGISRLVSLSGWRVLRILPQELHIPLPLQQSFAGLVFL